MQNEPMNIAHDLPAYFFTGYKVVRNENGKIDFVQNKEFSEKKKGFVLLLFTGNKVITQPSSSTANLWLFMMFPYIIPDVNPESDDLNHVLGTYYSYGGQDSGKYFQIDDKKHLLFIEKLPPAPEDIDKDNDKFTKRYILLKSFLEYPPTKTVIESGDKTFFQLINKAYVLPEQNPESLWNFMKTLGVTGFLVNSVDKFDEEKKAYDTKYKDQTPVSTGAQQVFAPVEKMMKIEGIYQKTPESIKKEAESIFNIDFVQNKDKDKHDKWMSVDGSAHNFYSQKSSGLFEFVKLQIDIVVTEPHHELYEQKVIVTCRLNKNLKITAKEAVKQFGNAFTISSSDIDGKPATSYVYKYEAGKTPRLSVQFLNENPNQVYGLEMQW